METRAGESRIIITRTNEDYLKFEVVCVDSKDNPISTHNCFHYMPVGDSIILKVEHMVDL